MAIDSFKDLVAKEFFVEGTLRKHTGWASIKSIVRRKLDMIHYASTLSDLRSPPGNQLESLREVFMIKINRAPTRPGEILNEEFLIPLKMTQKKLADHIGCDLKVINRIINGRTSVTAEMAIRIAAAFNTTPEFWLNAQKAVDIFEASKHIKKLPKSLLPTG